MKKTLNFILILFFSVTFLLTALFVIWGLKGFTANNWLIDKFEIEIESSLGASQVSISEIKFDFFNSNSFISATLFKIVLKDSEAKQLAYLNELEATFGYENLLQFNLKPNSLLLSNSSLVITKNLEGEFSFEMLEAQEPLESFQYSDVIDFIAFIEGIFEHDVLSSLSFFSGRNTNIAFVDQISGKTWWLKQGQFKLERLNQKLSAQFSANFLYGNNITARAMLKLVKKKGQEVEVSATVENILINQLSEQFPELMFLSKFNLPVSLSVFATLVDGGNLQGIQGVLEAGKGDISFPSNSNRLFVNSSKFYFEYDDEFESFNIKQASLDTEYGTTIGSGNILVDDQNSEKGLVFMGQLEFNDTNLFMPKYFTHALKLESLITDFKFELDKQSLTIGQFFASHSDIDISSSGRFRFTPKGLDGLFNFRLSDVATRTFAEIWPFVKGAKTKAWALDNIVGGYLKNVTGMMSFSPEKNSNLRATFLFDETNLKLPEKISPLINASGNGELGSNYFHLNLEDGHLFSQPTSLVDISGSVLRVLMGKNEDPLMNVHLNSIASLSSTLEILKDLPKNYKISKQALPSSLQGVIFAESDIFFELGKKPSETEIIFSTIGKIKSGAVNNIFGKIDLTADQLSLIANNKELRIFGDLDFDGNIINVNWKKNFEKDLNNISSAKGKLKLNQNLFDSLDFNLSDIVLSDNAMADFSIQFSDDSSPMFFVSSDLKGIGVKSELIDWVKKPKDSGQFLIEGTLGSAPVITNLMFSSDDLFLKGKVYFKDYAGMDKLVLKSLEFKDWLSTSVEITNYKKDNFVFEILNGELDLRSFKFDSGSKINLPKMSGSLLLDSVILSDTLSLTDLKVQFSNIDKSSGIFKSRINNGPEIEGLIKILENGLSFDISSKDAGAVLRSLGIFDNARKGDLNVILIPSVDEGIYSGELTVKNTRVVNASILAELLSAVSVIGLLEQMDGQGLAFSESKANFTILSDRILVHESSAIGASMGLTMQGNINPITEEIDAIGVITPFYAVNGIFEQTGLFAGLLGKKEGEGVFGFNYKINGSGNDLKIEVNPLSILTPGVFRELFNSPMPERLE